MPPSIPYFNQSAPFWDFVASFEDQAFKESTPAEKEESHAKADANNERPSAESSSGQRGPCGGAWARGGHCGGRRGGRDFHHRGGPWGMGPGMGLHPFFQFLQSQLDATTQGAESESNDFKPPVDVFSTPTAYHIHVSLPGVKKEDVGLNYDADKSELSIAGVIYRPGDEEFLKTLAMGERKVGVFERKVKLGNERHPAEVDIEGITAKLEDGVLKIEVPRMEKDFVNVKKVDIE